MFFFLIPVPHPISISLLQYQDPFNGGNANDEGGSKTRMRWGSSSRDFTVYTLNTFARIDPGDTYSYRQYFMADKFTELDATGEAWKSQAQQELIQKADIDTARPGRSVKLYRDASGSTFGSVIRGVSDVCSGANAELVCTGSTTANSNAAGVKPLYQISCGSSHTAVTADPYYFAPTNGLQTGVQLPYICKDDLTARPQYKLLGFFVEADCANIAVDYVYDELYCHSG